ncbi:hypothetical protein STIAU_3822 [Stigmatella aurantiaca DW4/3-1]|uniref:Uncharacterized protein n=1 Tax=Stigmatella aurantiaca (strain DW4/3-1) TaxID=378806 RepID=Q090V9_STIAD|nr:hypothetical protein STIAU_3822 [Stigmatella aurantiaca DW4/3-1]
MAQPVEVRNEEERLEGALQLVHHLLGGKVLLQRRADELADLLPGDVRVGPLVPRHEEVAPVLALGPAVHLGVAGGEVHAQLVGLDAELSAAALQIGPGEPLVHLALGGLELAHLQGGAVMGGIPHGHEEHLGVLHAGVQQRLHEGGQVLARQQVRDGAHGAGDVEREHDAQGAGVGRAVPALADLHPARVHQGVAVDLGEHLLDGPVRAGPGHRLVCLVAVASVSHGVSLLCGCGRSAPPGQGEGGVPRGAEGLLGGGVEEASQLPGIAQGLPGGWVHLALQQVRERRGHGQGNLARLRLAPEHGHERARAHGQVRCGGGRRPVPDVRRVEGPVPLAPGGQGLPGGEAQGARPAHQHHPVVPRVHEQVGGQHGPVHVPAAVDEGEHLEHALPHPHGRPGVHARGVGVEDLGEGVLEAAAPAVHRRRPRGALGVFHGPLRHGLWQEPAEVLGALGLAAEQLAHHLEFAGDEAGGLQGPSHFEHHLLAEPRVSAGEKHVAAISLPQPPEEDIADPGHGGAGQVRREGGLGAGRGREGPAPGGGHGRGAAVLARERAPEISGRRELRATARALQHLVLHEGAPEHNAGRGPRDASVEGLWGLPAAP